MIVDGMALMIKPWRTFVNVVVVSITFRVGMTKTDGHSATDAGRY